MQPEQSYDAIILPNDGEVILKDMGEIGYSLSITQHNKTQSV